MKRPSYSPAVTISWLAVGLTAYAIMLGRGKPERAGRHPSTPRYHSIFEHVEIFKKYKEHLLDSASGRFVRTPLPAGDQILNSVSSPWCDDRGRTQMVGLMRESGGDAKVGLIRFTMPDGQILDEVEMSMTPTSRPCWYPGTSARVLFAAGDGRLYRLSFEETLGTHAPEFDEYLRPRLLTWRTEPPEQGGERMTDLVWPTDPRMEGRLVVSLRFDSLAERQQPSRSQLWWLKLGADGTAIEGAGRLTVPTPGVAEEERLSAFGRCPDGRLIVAYLARREDQRAWRWQLRLAPVVFDGPGGDPRVITTSSVTLGDDWVTTGPVIFSCDGCWVYALVGRPEEASRILRYSVVDAMRRWDRAGREDS